MPKRNWPNVQFVLALRCCEDSHVTPNQGTPKTTFHETKIQEKSKKNRLSMKRNRRTLKAHPTPYQKGSICSLRDSLEARRRMERAPAAVQGAAPELPPAR